jgi:SAM-dependent methyltransferase
MYKTFDSFGHELRKMYLECPQRDGSEAFDCLFSIHQYYYLYKLTQDNLSPHSTVLDWGSGSGHFSYYLAKHHHKVTAYAFSQPSLLEKDPNHFGVKVIIAPTFEPTLIPLPDTTFDAIFSVGVLEHVREYKGSEQGSIAEIHRLLKTDGLFFCYHLPNKYSWIEFLAKKVGKWSHEYKYNTEDVHQLFDKANWEILVLNRYAILPRNSMRKILPTYLKDSTLVTHILDTLDTLLSRIFSPITQNWIIIAKKI